MRKNYHSVYVGMLYVIGTREQYLHLYCLRILFIFFVFVCESVDKRGFPHSFLLSGFMTVRETLHLLLSLSIPLSQSARSLSLIGHLEQANPSAGFSYSSK